MQHANTDMGKASGSLFLAAGNQTAQLTVNDRREDSHPFKVGIAHCLVQNKASKTGKFTHSYCLTII